MRAEVVGKDLESLAMSFQSLALSWTTFLTLLVATHAKISESTIERDGRIIILLAEPASTYIGMFAHCTHGWGLPDASCRQINPELGCASLSSQASAETAAVLGACDAGRCCCRVVVSAAWSLVNTSNAGFVQDVTKKQMQMQ